MQIAKVLAAVLKRDDYDLILAGKQAIDDDAGQVALMLAEYLDCGHASVVTKLELGDGTFTATREIEGGAEIVTGSLPTKALALSLVLIVVNLLTPKPYGEPI